MDIVIAIAHIAGSIVVLIIFSTLVMYMASIEAEKIQKQASAEVSVALGIPVEKLESEAYAKKILEYSHHKFSSDLFQNRLSDLCGSIRTLWDWLSTIAQLLILAVVCWYTVTDNLDNAIYSWWLVGAGIAFWLISYVFSLTCNLFTGRYPGQAKRTRESVSKWLKENGDVLLRQE
ncbi:hypothetical protein [Moritella sp.]|uniref:hypothetical protein n=1 Tax=Moritella sp. TaxID=78556 RepID=UPI001DC434F0|nr:hypothetical protein [Moritella sp.]MCJ8352386.1 hypothetical protein [Moritella sp.]NQZ42669.1 hypothetical protein [Moritella sp.]